MKNISEQIDDFLIDNVFQKIVDHLDVDRHKTSLFLNKIVFSGYLFSSFIKGEKHFYIGLITGIVFLLFYVFLNILIKAYEKHDGNQYNALPLARLNLFKIRILFLFFSLIGFFNYLIQRFILHSISERQDIFQLFGSISGICLITLCYLLACKPADYFGPAQRIMR